MKTTRVFFAKQFDPAFPLENNLSRITITEMDEKPLVHNDRINQVVQTLLTVNEKMKKNNLASTLEPEVVSLQFGVQKIPSVQNKRIKIHLPHTLVQSTSDVCLFVKDLDKSNRDYEPTIRHYKDMFESKNINTPIDIIPLKSLKLEYKPYEAKRNLSNMYDIYLADDRVMGKLPALLGKNFLARKRFPLQVKLSAKDLKREFNNVLSMTQCIMSGRGSSCQANVAHTGMTSTQISDNVEATISKLAASIPGGPTNIKNLYLKTADSPALPLFTTYDSGEGIKLPEPSRETQELDAEDVTPIERGLVKITRAGRIRVISAKSQVKDTADSMPSSQAKNSKAKSAKKAPQKKKVSAKKSQKRKLATGPPKKKQKL